VPYGAFIVPGLMMLTMFTESISNASFGIYMPKWTGTIYEMLSAPLSPIETVIAYVGAAATKSVIIGAIIFVTAHLFVDVQVAHPLADDRLHGPDGGHILPVRLHHRHLGTELRTASGRSRCWWSIRLTFLGGAFYSLDMLPAGWRTITLFNPVVYLISGFRWTFFGKSDVGDRGQHAGVVALSWRSALAVVFWMFRTGYRLKN
jgi:ABC-2 type transport system permease protein